MNKTNEKPIPLEKKKKKRKYKDLIKSITQSNESNKKIDNIKVIEKNTGGGTFSKLEKI